MGGRGSVWSLPSMVFPRRFSQSILTIFMDFTDFSTFPCYKETNDVSILQMMSALFYFQLTLNNCIKLYLYHIKLVLLEIWKEGGQFPPRKKLLSKSPALLGLITKKGLFWNIWVCDVYHCFKESTSNYQCHF